MIKKNSSNTFLIRDHPCKINNYWRQLTPSLVRFAESDIIPALVLASTALSNDLFHAGLFLIVQSFPSIGLQPSSAFTEWHSCMLTWWIRLIKAHADFHRTTSGVLVTVCTQVCWLTSFTQVFRDQIDTCISVSSAYDFARTIWIMNSFDTTNHTHVLVCVSIPRKSRLCPVFAEPMANAVQGWLQEAL